MVFADSIIPTAHAAFDSAAFANVVNPVLNEIVYPIVYAVFALGVFMFAFGVIEMIVKGSAEARETGKRHIFYGVIGMFIMLSAWGIIHFVSDTLFAIRGAAVGGSNSFLGIQPSSSFQSVNGSSGTYGSVGGLNAVNSSSGSGGSNGGTYGNTGSGIGGSNSGSGSSANGSTNTSSATNCPPGDYDPTCTSHTGSASTGSSNSTSNTSASSANCPPGDYDPSCTSSNSSGSNSSSGVVNLSSGRTYDPATNQWYINGTPEANPNANNTSSGSGSSNSSSGSSAGCDTDSEGNCL